MRSSTRISTGGSGSVVSANGLVMTNHHVVEDILQKLSTAENNYLEKGFFARSRGEELKCPDTEINILWEIEDVTDIPESPKDGENNLDILELPSRYTK